MMARRKLHPRTLDLILVAGDTTLAKVENALMIVAGATALAGAIGLTVRICSNSKLGRFSPKFSRQPV